MKCAKLILCFMVTVLANYANGNAVNCKDVPGYYWRDYTGEVPEDAVPGGADTEGSVTYIGQTVQPGASLLPGKLKANQPEMFYEYGGAEQTSTEDVKILCSQHPEQLQWMSVKKGDFVTTLGKDKFLVLGGHDKSRSLVIGRKPIATGEVTVGKVLTVDYKFQSIFLADAGRGWSDNGPYEVLIYNKT